MLLPHLALVGVPPRLVELPLRHGDVLLPPGPPTLDAGAVRLMPWGAAKPLAEAALARLEGVEYAKAHGLDPTLVLLLMPRPECIQAWGPSRPFPPGWHDEDLRTWLLRL